VDADNANRSPTHRPGRSTTEGASISYVPRPDATPEGELAALAAVYDLVLKICDQREAKAEVSDDATSAEIRLPGEPAG
jgi:hypothetical protein